MSFLKKSKILRWMTTASLGGVVLAGGCSTEAVSAILAGVEAVASELDNRNRSDDVEFGEWLADAVEDF